MPFLMASMLQAEGGDELIPFGVIALGAVMCLIITLVHGAGLDQIISRYKRRAKRAREKSWNPKLAASVFAGTVLLLLFLHLAEICIWGLALRRVGLIHNIRDAVYFSANTYTTLGMGSMLLPHNWRELSPIIAITGLFTFAWTTSEMFNIVGDQRDLVAELRANRQKMAESGRDSSPTTGPSR